MSKVKVLMLGSDPEFLIRDIKSKKLISSIGIIPGTKEEPVIISPLGEDYTIQIDNVLGEVSVAPAADKEGLWNNIQLALNYVKNEILPNHLEIYHASSGEYDDDQLDNEVARTLGCSPSINAWTEDDNEAPDADSNFRGCGVHIHLSYENPNHRTNYELARAFDLFCTLPTLLVDEDTRRREFYGKAGEIRHCDYGLEFRTIGGFLLRSKDEYDYILNNLNLAIDFVNSGETIDDEIAFGIQLAINNQSKDIATEIMEIMKVPKYNHDLELMKA